MAYKSENYTPNAKSRAILAAAWKHVSSVPYQVSLRWLFYKVLQDSYYSDKDDYQTFVGLMSKVRHNRWGDWRPDTLVDDRHNAFECEIGDRDADEWVTDLARLGVKCNIDHWYRQSAYVELWFEADAMIRQFQYYTSGITLRPFGGSASIPYKWAAAKGLEAAANRYDLPVVVLYFGDYDKAGLTIPQIAARDVREWCAVDFELVRVGLNAGDAERYNIPENFEKPGDYQWEALGDDAARALIESGVSAHVNVDLISRAESESKQVEESLKLYLKDFAYNPV
jgi:hypothetical protein